ncbi:MAG: polyprenol monophosphomannose synthase [Bacteroidales bacterium]|nr:polyprenol monophosphomannose synthase [Bacteroidales bacterium]
MFMNEGLVIIPTYNEKENIESILRTVFALEESFDVLVVEDNSPDGTGRIVKTLMKEFPDRLNILERQGKNGLGTAYIAGFKWALERSYQYVFEMDADFSHNPADLVKLYAAAKQDGVDAVIGSRYITGVNVVNWPMGRVLMSYFASAYVRFVTNLNIRDTTAGFMCWTRKVLETIDLDNVEFVGYAFQIEMKYTAVKLGFNVVEVPIIFTDRTRGESKMNKTIFREAILGVIYLRKKGLMGKIKPRKSKN